MTWFLTGGIENRMKRFGDGILVPHDPPESKLSAIARKTRGMQIKRFKTLRFATAGQKVFA